MVEQLTCRPLSQEDKGAICAWRYPGEYGVYDFPSLAEMAEQGTGFMAPGACGNYLGWHGEGTLIGFTKLQAEEKGIFVGIGVNPAHLSQGWGRRILEKAALLCQERWPGKPLYLIVRTWNQRAIRCYKKAGFVIDGPPFEMTTGMGPGTFYRMTRS